MSNFSLLKKTISLLIFLIVLGVTQNALKSYASGTTCEVDLTNLKYKINGSENTIKDYTQDEYDQFVTDFKSNTLPEIYITEFLYDGSGMVKTPDLDDFIESGSNDTKIKTLSIKAININMYIIKI